MPKGKTKRSEYFVSDIESIHINIMQHIQFSMENTSVFPRVQNIWSQYQSIFYILKDLQIPLSAKPPNQEQLQSLLPTLDISASLKIQWFLFKTLTIFDCKIKTINIPDLKYIYENVDFFFFFSSLSSIVEGTK